MRSRTIIALAALALIATACSRSTSAGPGTMAPAPAPVVATAQPAGRWSVALIAQGQAFDFVMDLRQAGDNTYSGVVTSQAFPPMNISNATLTGNRMKMSVLAPTGDMATFDIVFEGDTFTGDWSMPGDGSKVSGKRIE